MVCAGDEYGTRAGSWTSSLDKMTMPDVVLPTAARRDGQTQAGYYQGCANT
jgi:hypothetical protein